MNLKILAMILVVLNVGDQISTYYGLRAGGVEMNPMFRWLFANIGFGWSSVIKIGLALCLALLTAELARRRPDLSVAICRGLFISNCLLIVAITNNVVGLIRK